MAIAILGWGSLLWDKRPEFEQQIEDWKFDGPNIELEFSRISKSRQGALTLVIDKEHGAQCQIAYAISKRNTLEDAVCDLRCREGTIHKRIGFLTKKNEHGEPDIPGEIEKWLKDKQFDAVVWTGLSGNFKEKREKNFTVADALAYLAQLPRESKALAAEYIWRAPDFVQTELRTAVEVEPWFAAATGAMTLDRDGIDVL